MEKFFISPKPGRSRAQIYPASGPVIGQDHSNQLEIPGIVLTLLWFLLLRLGFKYAIDVPLKPSKAFSISSPVVKSNPNQTYLLIACDIYNKIKELKIIQKKKNY
jgi:hypothetical protein